MSTKTVVDLKPPPFACRGRQLHLKEPLEDGLKRARIRSLVHKRKVGAALGKVRGQDESDSERFIAEAFHRNQVVIEKQERLLSARIRSLEQQHDTLGILLEQIDRLKEKEAKQDESQGAASAEASSSAESKPDSV